MTFDAASVSKSRRNADPRAMRHKETDREIGVFISHTKFQVTHAP